MEVDKSALYPEILAVVNGSANPVHFTWAATIHVNQRGADFPVMKVLSVDKLSDYELGISDVVILTIGIPAGLFGNQIYPFQNDLDITLVQYPLAEIGDRPTAGRVVARRMQATLIDNGDPQMLGQSLNAASQEALDLNNFIEVQFQLIDKSLEQLRMTSFGNIGRATTVEDYLKANLTTYARSVQVDETLKLRGVDIVPPSNTKRLDHIVVPQAEVQLLDVPDYLQQKYGIYSAGLGSYIRDRYWYLYPCLDLSRFNQAQDIATIIVVPSNRFTGVERTYRQDPGNLVIIATGEVQFRGDATPQQLNYGNGVRYADASRIMEGYATPKDGKALAARGNVNSEFITTERPNGLNNVRPGSKRFTANPYQQASQLARRNGSVISVLWENSNDELLKPSMMVNILYLQNDQVRSLKGVLLKTHTYTELAGQGFTQSRYVSRTGISCFVNNVIS